MQQEIVALQVALLGPKQPSVIALIKLLKATTYRAPEHIIGKAIADTKDPRAVGPLVKAATSSGGEGHRCKFLWPLENFDCTAHVSSLVKLLVSRTEYDEVTWACIEVIRKMKGPFEPVVARRNIRKLLAEPNKSLPEAERTALAAFRLEAADFIMAKYFNQTLKSFWKEWNKR